MILRHGRILAPLLAIALLVACSGGGHPGTDRDGAGAPHYGEPPIVRVLISAASGGKEAVLTLAGPYRVTAADDPDDLHHEAQATGRVVIRADGDGLSVDGARIDETEVRLDPGPATIGIGTRIYSGALVAHRDDEGDLEVVLHLDLEAYVPGVVGGEMPASFGAAALEAQVIAARTYVLECAERRSGEIWDVTDDTRSQMFVGIPRGATAATFEAAATATRGLVLLYESRLFPCYYHGTCGGQTASAVEVFGRPDIPPLAGVPCGTCEASPRHRWQVVVKAESLAKAAGVEGRISGVTVASRTPSGRARDLTFAGSSPKTISAFALRRALKSPHLPATGITDVRAVRGGFEFRGGGHGHGVGLCQYGASGRAARGFSTTQILLDYYPGATVSRVY